MFETAVDEIAVVNAKKRYGSEDSVYMNTLGCAYVNGFQDGAEFGYSKANEWHYPSKGEYPKEGENVWCYCKGIGIKFCCAGHTIVGGDNKVRWWEENKAERLFVIAWKEIILPEIKE